MLEGKDYCTADIVFLIMRGFIDRVTGYKMAPNMTRLHAMYSLLMNINEVMSDNWRPRRGRENIKAFSA